MLGSCIIEVFNQKNLGTPELCCYHEIAEFLGDVTYPSLIPYNPRAPQKKSRMSKTLGKAQQQQPNLSLIG